MMKNLIDAVVMLFGMLIAFDSANIDDYRTYDDLTVYEQRLCEFNEKYGTDFMIPYESANGSHEEVVDFFTSMNLKEFDEYIMSLYIAEKNAPPDPLDKYKVTDDTNAENSSQEEQSNNDDSFSISSDLINNLPFKNEGFSIELLE